MFRTLACMALLTASASFAQTASDDLTSAENWWDRVGAGFFSDKGLTLLRPEAEIRAHWTGLSADDQAAVLKRCTALMQPGGSTGGAAALVPSEQSGSNTEAGVTVPGQSADGGDRPAQEATPRADDTAPAAPDTSDQTSITGAVDGQEVHTPAEGTEPYTGLAGGADAERTGLRSVCSVVAGI